MKTITPKTYDQSAVEHRMESSDEFARQISAEAVALFAEAERIGEQTIICANRTRKIGLLFSAWMDKEQMRFEQFEGFMRAHSGKLPAWLNSHAARKFISAHKAYPDEIEDVTTAQQMFTQLTLFAVGIIEEPKRLLAQTASGITPLERLVSLFGKEREQLAKFREEMPETKWTPEIWFTIKSQTKEAAELYAKAVEALK